MYLNCLRYPICCSSTSSVVGSGSLPTGHSGSPLVESEVDSDSFGLLSGFGVPGPFMFRLQKKQTFLNSHHRIQNQQSQ